MKKEKIKAFFKKINGTRGVISLFLALVMIPFVSIAGILINASRINSAVAVFDEAMCNASNSTLGTYDDFIRKRFALMAMSQDTASGAQKFGKSGVDYTADAFISDLFRYYMEKNLGALSNTYNSNDVNAIGLYPLADPDVLKASVLQAGKITVPAKLVVDWGSIDDLLSKFTEPLDLLSTFASTLTSGANVATGIDKLLEKQTALENAITDCDSCNTEYKNARSGFSSAVTAYNGLIDNIVYWQSEVNRLQIAFDELKQKAASVNAQIDSTRKQIEKLQKDKSTDHSAEISALNTKIVELEEEREEVAPGYSQTESELNSAKTSLQICIDDLPNKRTEATNAKNNYYNKIVAMRDQINATGTAATEFQDACTSLVNDGVGLVKNVVTTGMEVQMSKNEKQGENLKKENEKYQQQISSAKNEEEAQFYSGLIAENNDKKTKLDEEKRNYKNAQTVTDSTVSAAEDAGQVLTDFADRDLKTAYRNVYNALDELLPKVNGITIPNTQNKISYIDYYYEVANPISKSEVSAVIENVTSQITNNVGWEALKAIVGFLTALFKIELIHSPNLTSNINTEHYSSVGGLPSQRTNTNYASPYDAQDAKKAEKNKVMLNSYSDVEVYEVQGGGITLLEEMMGYINDIKAAIDDFSLKKLKVLWDAATGFVSCLTQLASTIIADGATALVKGLASRFILVGYISYNTANRTTYQGAGLTGESYGLPPSNDDSGYAFSGAETEYIFHGSMSEVDNQTSVFNAIWLERMLFDIVGVVTDATIQTIATTIGSVTFGIGTVVTYILVIVAEGLVDAVILVNGGDIPIVKTFAYLSPTGILKLVEKICSLKLSDALQKTIYDSAKNCATNINDKAKASNTKAGNNVESKSVSLPSYDEYKTTAKAESEKREFVDIFSLDYTKSLQIIMLLFSNTDKMVKRLADIIQMEATYRANQGILTYNFDLAKSYTYLRAEGNFGSDVFIRVGDSDKLNSNNRVIYNGY